jgi:hypothetical protein
LLSFAFFIGSQTLIGVIAITILTISPSYMQPALDKLIEWFQCWHVPHIGQLCFPDWYHFLLQRLITGPIILAMHWMMMTFGWHDPLGSWAS